MLVDVVEEVVLVDVVEGVVLVDVVEALVIEDAVLDPNPKKGGNVIKLVPVCTGALSKTSEMGPATARVTWRSSAAKAHEVVERRIADGLLDDYIQ